MPGAMRLLSDAGPQDVLTKKASASHKALPRQSASSSRSQSYRHECPHCGAHIVSVRMPRGGWAHFEDAKGLGQVKHPCMHIGEGLSKRRDEETPNFF